LLECVKAQQYVEYDKFWKNYIYASFYACAYALQRETFVCSDI